MLTSKTDQYTVPPILDPEKSTFDYNVKREMRIRFLV